MGNRGWVLTRRAKTLCEAEGLAHGAAVSSHCPIGAFKVSDFEMLLLKW